MDETCCKKRVVGVWSRIWRGDRGRGIKLRKYARLDFIRVDEKVICMNLSVCLKSLFGVCSFVNFSALS